MFVKSDPVEEERMLEGLISAYPEAREAHRSFEAEMAFKEKLLEIRKKEALTQKDIAERSGLSQQAVSRAERVQGTTLETVIRYLSAMGYVLGIEKLKG
ncbi:MAG: helix-turn-helix transcriptional regulator [Lachnospiraceae bacterium]|nr:helix-turn-helix transcriptional regulator [Lachnospiraceae bacterium]